MADVRDAQAADGRLPDFAPHPYDPNQRFSGNPGWGDAGVIVPWNQYVNYGDERILADQFDAARRYIEWSLANNPDLIWRNAASLSPLWYGDWLNADTFANLPNIPKTGGEVSKEIYSTAFFARSTELTSRMAAVLGKDAEARDLAELAARIRAAFNAAFVDADGRIAGDTQAGYALALNFDLLPDPLRPAAARHMVAALEPYNGAPSTGIQSTVRLMLELSRWGYHDQAYAILLRREMPSWGYMVEHGGTTIWERWDGWVEGRGFQNPGMNSFNHYAIGAVGEWVYRVVGGLNPDEHAPGWKHFFVRPVPPARRSLGEGGGGGPSHAATTYDSIRGAIRSAWRIRDGQFELEIAVPPNTTATVELPDGTVHDQVTAGKHNFACSHAEHNS
jgi:alpha-L-rhamnosidase